MFDVCTANVDMKTLEDFREMCMDDDSCKMASITTNFDRQFVHHWNPSCDNVTQSRFLGVSGVDEAVSEETTTLVLSPAMKGRLVAGRVEGKKVVYFPVNNL